MILSGHDPLTGHLFTWNKEFKYAGRVNNPPGTCLSVKDGSEYRLMASIQGAYFLSGNCESAWVFHADQEERIAIAASTRFGILAVEQKKVCAGFTNRIILCGPKVADPAYVSAFCKRFPCNPMYVCHLTDELPAFGILANELVRQNLDKPRRAFLYQAVTDELPSVFQETYEDKFESDAYGRMAFVINRGFIAKNEIMTGPGINFFYGQFLSWKSVFKNPTYIINSKSMQIFAPMAPISLKLYAATSVPVLAPVSDDFRQATGYQEDTAIITVASDFIPGLGDFIHFFGSMSKSGVLCSGNFSPGEITGNFPVFRYNKMHVIDAQLYMEKS